MRDALNLAIEDKLDLNSLQHAADEPYYIPEATPLNVQLSNFKNEKAQLFCG